MNPILIVTALSAAAGVVACTPTVEDAWIRSILYWVFIPSFVMGILAIRQINAF